MNNISKKWMKWIALFTLAALCIGFAGGRAATKAETAENHKIADGVYIGNVYVGGMTEEEAGTISPNVEAASITPAQ